MKLSDIGEFGLIGRIRRTFAGISPAVTIGIGDDAALLSLSPRKALLATTDMLVEGVHFDLATTDLRSLGWKSAAANLSDIAAMGGEPRFCLVGLGLPSRMTVEQVRKLYGGMRMLLRQHRTLLVGGDTCRSDRGLVISVTLLGEAKKKQVATRSGARPGDLLFVTGTLGDSAAGLELLCTGARDLQPGARRLVKRHLRPVPRVEWGRRLAASGCVSAMIDVSDGLSSDLAHICEESRVGAVVHADRVPLSRAIDLSRALRRPALDYALSGGEDYELLFTVPRRKAERIGRLHIPATEIGMITKDGRMTLISPDGERRRFNVTGFEHFGGRRRTRGGNR